MLMVLNYILSLLASSSSVLTFACDGTVAIENYDYITNEPIGQISWSSNSSV